MVKQAPAPAGSERFRARVGQGSRKTEPPLITQSRYRSGAMVDRSRYERTILTGTQNRRHQGDDVGGFPGSGGGGIRTRDLWVMSPTSCRCSTPRRLVCGAGCVLVCVQGGCARSGLASHGVAPAVLSGAELGHDRVRDGTGWSQFALGHGHTTPAHTHKSGLGVRIYIGVGARRRGFVFPGGNGARRRPAWGGTEGIRGDPPSAMSTGRLRSVARRPPPASQPGRLPGAFLVSDGETRLGAGFPLRCFQRFAHPDVATQRCRFPDNWHTSGPSSPVLSY
jgi:hypothetical protein